MKRSMFILLSLVLAGLVSAHVEGAGTRINWYTNYDEAVKVSRSSSKPMLLLFTGSDWCSWCIKLEKEVFNTPEFADAASDKFVFVKLDFPVNKPLSPEATALNKRLQKDFNVSGFPTVVLLDSQQKSIGSTGYRPGGGKQYAQYLFKLLAEKASYQQKVSALDKEELSSSDLKQLYEKAVALGHNQDVERIVTAGMQSDQQQFFLIEKYRKLALEGQLQSPEAVSLKEQLISGDPQNAKQIQYQIAMIDFDTLSHEMHEGVATPEETVAPLVSYITQFGETDKSNLWRLEMLISQTYYTKDKITEALEFAEFSYNAAPATAQPEIATAIKNMRCICAQ
jgi:protein disulfide-isomerase